MKIAPLTVLAWEGPLARAYLVRMAKAGFRPARVRLIVADPLMAAARRPARFRGAGFLRWARGVQDRSHNHHPRRIRREQPALTDAIAAAMERVVDGATQLIGEMYDGFAYERYTDDFRMVAANGYGDPALRRALEQAGPATVLYTGGGRVPASLLAVPGLRMIHVHTGLLPHVRGADVLLWSLMVRRAFGVSAFVMTPALDAGDVLAARELPSLRVDLSAPADDETLYRALFSFIDPLLRARLFVEDVLDRDGVPPPAGAPQDLAAGTTYHFMHGEVRARALRELFRSPRPAPGRAAGPSPGRYRSLYARRSLTGRARLRLDAFTAPTPLRALSVRNRLRDYTGLAARPELRPLHAEFNRQLARQADEWPSYDYGEGWFYQSSSELGITGLRDTGARLRAYDLPRRVAGRSVLEIGCNAGFLSLAMAATASRVVAFEPNPYQVAIARAGAAFLHRANVDFQVADFERFESAETFDTVVSLANHDTFDGNTCLTIDEYFARCHALTKPGGQLVFESHPPALEGNGFGRTLDALSRWFAIESSDVHDIGTFLDRNRRFIVAVRR